MLPKCQDLILKEKIKLYNNIAQINSCEGRLLAELEVYPTPRIIWEFEILGDVQCDIPRSAVWNSDKLNPLKGYCFSIEKPVYIDDYTTVIGPLRAMKGTTAQGLYGDMSNQAHEFIFYLPNTRFQYKSNRQYQLQANITETGTGNEVKSWSEGKYIDLPIDKIWSIRLEIANEALNWLKPENRNTGTLITTIGKLYQQTSGVIEPKTFAELKTITLNNAFERITNLCWLLSYLNGGFTAPIYTQGEKYTQNSIQTSCALTAIFNTTPLEQLGHSWVTQNSNLTAYVKCFSTFERMIQNQSWRDTFNFTLNQYFQATRSRMAWEVVASAVGAALERLSYTILVEEETNTAKKDDYELLFDVNKSQAAKQHWNLGKNPGQENISPTSKRLILLLERIGLTKSRVHSDIDDVPLFLKVRNDAVHPRVGSMTLEQRWKLINQSIQWIDEVLLWRLGYSGEYLDRTKQWTTSITPRYDLSLRNSNW